MRIYLVRHGEAMNGTNDGARPLSRYGCEEVERVAAFLKSKDVNFDTVWHSTKARARQTAEILAESLGGKLHERPGLAPNDSPNPIAAELRSLPDTNLCIVTHLPFVSQLASELVAGSNAAAWNFSTAAVLCLEREATGRWWAHWFISPELLPAG